MQNNHDLELAGRILIVDDNPSIHEDFRQILSVLDSSNQEHIHELARKVLGDRTSDQPVANEPTIRYDLDFAFQGREALDMVLGAEEEGAPYALVFMDVRMPPGWNGIETIQRIWKNCPELEIVICTAHADYDWEEVHKLLGTRDHYLFLKKPFESIEVKQMALALTTKDRLRREAHSHLQALEENYSRLDLAYTQLNESQKQKQAVEVQLVQSQKMEVIGTLVGGLAHDFNNILGAIIGTVDLLRMKLEDGLEEGGLENLMHKIEMIEECTLRGESLVKQLNGLSRKAELRFEVMDLRDSLESVSQICSGTFPKSISLQLSLPKEPSLVLADRTQVEQVLLNLCVNARDAMPRGGELCLGIEDLKVDDEFCLHHPEAVESQYFCLLVRDNGTGMDPSICERIFDPFFTTKPRGSGTGLGLAMCYQLVRQHQGWIEVESSAGEGSSLKIYFPATSKKAKPSLKSEDSLRIGSGRILVVDDESMIRSVFQELLTRFGYEVEVAADGLEVLALLKEPRKSFDLVILDVIMPGMNGYDTFQGLKKLAPEIPVLAVSGYQQDPLVQKLLSEGIAGFVDKPYNARKLLKSVQAILEPNEVPTLSMTDANS
jgi:two-component system, NtrC family, sensor kinase